MIKFDRNKPFNNLPVLPPNIDLEQDTEVLKKLISTSRALATVNGSINRLPNPYMLINTIALQEAKSSTEIENIFTTEDELYKAISNSKSEEKVNAATKEVLKYREALWSAYHYLQEHGVIDTKLIKNIANQIKETEMGFRSPQARVVIRRGESEFRPGEVIYTPPRGEEVLNTLVDNMLVFLNDDKKYTMDPLLKMCIAHYQFEAIHPFQDGNGRAGRILNLIYLVSKGLISQPSLYLSKYIILNKDDYYFNLSGVTQRNDWKAWVMYMLNAVEYTSNHTNRMVNEIIEQMDATLAIGKEKIKWYNKDVNEAIFSQAYIKAGLIGQVIGKSSRTTITKYMGELIEHKILSPHKEGKEIYYLNDDLIRILES